MRGAPERAEHRPRYDMLSYCSSSFKYYINASEITPPGNFWVNTNNNPRIPLFAVTETYSARSPSHECSARFPLSAAESNGTRVLGCAEKCLDDGKVPAFQAERSKKKELQKDTEERQRQ